MRKLFLLKIRQRMEENDFNKIHEFVQILLDININYKL